MKKMNNEIITIYIDNEEKTMTREEFEQIAEAQDLTQDILYDDYYYSSIVNMVYLEDYCGYTYVDNEHYYCEDCGDCYGEYDNLMNIDDHLYCENCVDNHRHTENTYLMDYVSGVLNNDNYYDKPLDFNTYYADEVDYHEHEREFKKFIDQKEKWTNKEFLGCEIEVDGGCNKDEAMGFINNNLLAQTMEDGSLSDNGFEIITNPLSLNAWLNSKNRLEKVFSHLTSNYGYKSHDTNTCGLHIHISRDALGDTIEEQEKTLLNIDLLVENFKSEIQVFARRSGGSYRCYLNTNNIKYSKDNIKKYKDKYAHNNVINEQHRDTIEFRMFKGTLNTDTLLASIELVHNIVAICKDDKLLSNLTWSKIIHFDYFPELINYNKSRGIKSNKRFKDHTELERIKKQKEELRQLNIITKQMEFITEVRGYIINNIDIIEKITNVYKSRANNTYLSNINNMLENVNKFRGIAPLDYQIPMYYSSFIKLLDNIMSIVSYSFTYEIINSEEYKCYSDTNFKNLTEYFKEFKKELERIKKEGVQ